MAADYASIFTALAGAAGGGLGLKIIDSLLIRGGRKDDSAFKFREEQRQEIQRLKTELVETERALDDLKIKFYALNQELSNIIFQLKFVLDQMDKGAVIDLRQAFVRFLEMATGQKYDDLGTIDSDDPRNKKTSEEHGGTGSVDN